MSSPAQRIVQSMAKRPPTRSSRRRRTDLRWSFPFVVALCPQVAGCVVGAEVRPSRDEALTGPMNPPRTAAAYLAAERRPVVAPEPAAEHRPGNDVVWVAGHAHWNGVEYVYVPGRWEGRTPSYTWR